MWQYNYSPELYHYGVLGMKWGVRRYQNKDGTLTKTGAERYRKKIDSSKKVIENKDGSKTYLKGYKFNRVSGSELRPNAVGILYVSSSKNDLEMYIKCLGPTLFGKLMKTGGTHVQELVVDKPLKCASYDQYNELAVKYMAKNKKYYDTITNDFYALAFPDNDKMSNPEYLKKALSNTKSIEARRLGLMSNNLLANDAYKNINADFVKYLSKHYDAVPDTHDVISGSETPMCIINHDKVKLINTTYIDRKRMKEARKFVKSIGEYKITEEGKLLLN